MIEAVLAPLRAVVADPATPPLQRELTQRAIMFLQNTWNAVDTTVRTKMRPSLKILPTYQISAIVDLCFQCACAAVKANKQAEVTAAVLEQADTNRPN